MNIKWDEVHAKISGTGYGLTLSELNKVIKKSDSKIDIRNEDCLQHLRRVL